MDPACKLCHGHGYRRGDSGETARVLACTCATDCVTCSGSHYTIVIEDGYEIAKPCACVATLERVRLFNEANVPGGYGRKSIPEYMDHGGNQGAIKQKLLYYQKRFDSNKSKGLLLVGDPGTGKTHLLCGLVNYLTLERGIGCHFVDFFHLTARIRATFGSKGKGSESESDILDALVKVPVLVIDELGKGLGSAWELGIVDQLISRRYNAGRIVLATSNYMPELWLQNMAGRQESLEERVGGRIYSRLAEICDVERIDGPDHRILHGVGGAPATGANAGITGSARKGRGSRPR